ncbi:MAG: T9SS type A sorting domain-containing protein [Gemmatimonadales bacterium]|nr:T9SS type A sorting domain-containing protein [Gemmatimonadales bacterium]
MFKGKWGSFRRITILLASLLLLVPAFTLGNTVASSTMQFQGDLTDNGDGTYTGVVAAVSGGGFDIFAEEGALAYFGNDPGTGVVWTTEAIAANDAWPTWTPDTPDWYQYSISFYEESGLQRWALRNHAGATETNPWNDEAFWGVGGAPARGVPMSGVVNWGSSYAAETDIGAYLPEMGTAEIPGGAATQGGGRAAWDMDWSWGSEVVPLATPGFSIDVQPNGLVFDVTLTPADAPLVVDTDWNAFIIRENATEGAPLIYGNSSYGVDAVEFAIFASSQKAGLGTNKINNVQVSSIATLHVDRLDEVAASGSLYGPYFNIWITDGLGNYAVIANEPSDGEWAESRWDVSDWDFLKTKRCKVYETAGWNTGTSWVHDYVGTTLEFTFEDVGGLIIEPPSPAYIAASVDIGSGAPDELGTNIACGFNWIFGDTAANYVTGNGEGFVVYNYSATATFPVINTTQGIGYSTISAAVADSDAGDTITVAAGHYEEQVHIAKDNLTIMGAGVGVTFVDAPNDMPLFFMSSAANYPVVFVDGASGTNLSGFTIDGQGYGQTNYRFIGLGLYNADGQYSEMASVRVRNEPLDGGQHGIGIYAYNEDTAARTASFTDFDVSDFQKNGSTFHGAGLEITALRLNNTGAGPLGVGLPAQNGIQLSGGANGVFTDCAIADINYTDPSWAATGLLVFGPGTGEANGCTITRTSTSVYYIDASGLMDDCTISDPQGDPLYAYSSGAKAKMKISPQPFDSPAETTVTTKAAISFTLLNSTFIGNDVVDSWGPTAWASGPIDFNVQGCTIEHFDYGLCLYEDGGTITGSASGNVLANNLNFGSWSNTGAPYDARGNDWGHFSGPYHLTLNPAGSGNAVSDNILFDPWVGMGNGSIIPVTTGPLNCSQPITLTFNYTADDETPDMFLYNAVISATAGLDFGLVHDLEPFGDVNNNFYAMETGANQWTITGSTVGNPSSPVTGAGTTGLFQITFSATGDVVGDVLFESLTLRDPDNNTIPVAFTGASITYDCTAPAAVTGITADPHHRRVEVDWNHTGVDVDHYVMFFGLWHDGAGASVYPEYDDVTNTIPTRPADFDAAMTSTEWNDLPQVAVTNGNQVWTTTPDRGVYYYEVFAVDAAGNTSAPATANDRATNYWLGDVDEDGFVTPLSDITPLGNSFGTSDGHEDYDALCDVGRTDDWSRVGIPLTDSVINFEDLMVFSMNFGVVSDVNKAENSVAKSSAPVIAKLEWVQYDVDRYALRLIEADGLKGIRVRANLPAGRISSVTAGLLLDEQDQGTFLRNVGQSLDVSLAVMGVNTGFAGQGDLFIVESNAPIDPAELNIELRSIDNTEIELIMGQSSGVEIPRVFNLNANYPNPFNPMTKISFSLPEEQAVTLAIYGVDGRKVATLINENRKAGLHEVIWMGKDESARSVASGIYFYRIDAGPYSEVRKMTLMK